MGESEASSKSDEIVLGIDLGTSNSCVAIWDNGRAEIITNNDGNRITPSYVAFTEEDETLVGDAAKNQLSHAPQNTIFGVKRLIGRKFSDPRVQDDIKLWPFKVVEGEDDEPEIVVQYEGKDQRFRPQQISAMVLSKLKEEAEKKLNRGPIKNAVVTVPAYFNDSQRKGTKDAASVAGLNVLRVINEPTAAAVAYGLDKKHHSDDGKKNIMIYDLGGGTLDVSLVEIQNSIVEVKATSGDTHLGGEDLDNKLVDYVIRKFKDKTNHDISNIPKVQRKLKSVCEETKKNLSTNVAARLEIGSLYKDEDFFEKINRSKFEELNENFFEKCIEPVKQCLKDANMDRANVDEVVLVGGSSRIPRVRELLKEFFGGESELCHTLNPDEAVAQGAAILGAKLIKEDQDDPALKDLDLKDVTPLSLGVEAKGGIMDVIIKRSSSIPIRKNKIHTTIRDNQSTMNFKVYEGERLIAKDNHLLGRFQLTGIPPAPTGVPEVEISFVVDMNGMLQVTAKDSRCGNAQAFRVDERSGGLSRDKIEEMIKLAEKFKAEDEKKAKKLLAKNDLEDYARLVIRKVDRSSEEKLGEFIRNQVKSAANEAIAWAEGRGLETEEVEFKTMKENLQAMCRPYEEELELFDI